MGMYMAKVNMSASMMTLLFEVHICLSYYVVVATCELQTICGKVGIDLETSLVRYKF